MRPRENARFWGQSTKQTQAPVTVEVRPARVVAADLQSGGKIKLRRRREIQVRASKVGMSEDPQPRVRGGDTTCAPEAPTSSTEFRQGSPISLAQRRALRAQGVLRNERRKVSFDSTANA